MALKYLHNYFLSCLRIFHLYWYSNLGPPYTTTTLSWLVLRTWMLFYTNNLTSGLYWLDKVWDSFVDREIAADTVVVPYLHACTPLVASFPRHYGTCNTHSSLPCTSGQRVGVGRGLRSVLSLSVSKCFIIIFLCYLFQ